MKLLNADTDLDWKNYAVKYVQHIFQFCKQQTGNLPFHGLDLKLVVLTQLSSCYVETVFLQLGGNFKACREVLYEYMKKFCLMLQFNLELNYLIDVLE